MAPGPLGSERLPRVGRTICVPKLRSSAGVKWPVLSQKTTNLAKIMKPGPKVSIAMCTCNGEAYLREQLDSILAQTVPPDELIVCDDASTDGTLDIVNSFQQRCAFTVKVVSNKRRLGVCKNFENAIRQCSGDMIFLSDQDDVWVPSKIDTIVAAFDQHPRCGYVFSNADLIDENGKFLGKNLWDSIGFDKKLQSLYASTDQLDIMLKRLSLVYGMTLAFRGEFKGTLIPFEGWQSQPSMHDNWICLMLTCLGAYGGAIPDRLVKYRQHENQLASAGRTFGPVELILNKRSRAIELNLDFAELLEHLAARLDQIGQNDQTRRARTALREKALHLRARVNANSQRGLERLKIVFTEAASGRYSRYSRSLKSIIKDLTTG
jgi:glycosyltransferase involved in cell wall biosynthesis